MNLPQLRYQCDNCGLCCNHTLISCTAADREREPKLKDLLRIVDKDGKPLDRYLLNRKPDDPAGCGCQFHTGTGCGIYPTRPGVCVSFMAGNPDCQTLRRAAGLPELVPVTVEVEEDRFVQVDTTSDWG